ncbi:MAG: putative transporter [Bacteroidota bacterium]|nr:putative transporter [Bacteroidota bacterium]
MNWFQQIFLQQSITQTVIIYGLVIAAGTLFGKFKIFGISLGVTWILFMGLLVSYVGVNINKETESFLKEFGLILFVYCIGLQVGPGFFASLKKNALLNNALATAVVISGVLITISFFYITGTSVSIMTGIMSGAVTNTPGLGAAQTAVTDMHLAANNNSLITLAYALIYPFGVFGIIFSILVLKWIFKINVDAEIELHGKLSAIKAEKPTSVHLILENKQLIGQPIRRIFEMIKEPIVVSRMFHDGTIITPTPDVILNEHDVLLIVAPKQSIQQLKIIIGSESDMNLKEAPQSELISRIIVVTRKEITHRRLGDIPALHQHGFTLTRLSRAGIEMVPHGDIILQLGDNIKVVGTKEAVELVANVLGNSLKRLEVPDLAPIFIGIVLGAIIGSIPLSFPNMPVPVKIGLAGGPLIVALLLSRFGNILYLNNYTTNSANLMVREIGITLFLASVGLSSGHSLSEAFNGGNAWLWIAMGICITMIPLILIGLIARYFLRKTYFEICGLLAGASTDPPALAFAMQMAKSDVPSVTYATVYPLTMILRIIAAQLLILLFAS